MPSATENQHFEDRSRFVGEKNSYMWIQIL